MARKEELIQELADKYHVDKDEVAKVVNAQFQFTAERMADGEFPEIRLPYFGVFKANEKRIKHLNKSKSKNKNNNES